nr:hypothetical protein [uncultured Blautia sp.]
MLVAISIPIFTKQLERSRDAVTVSNIRAAYAMSQTAYLTQQGDSGNGVTYTPGTNGAATIEVTGVVAKGTLDGWSGTTDDLVVKNQVEANCGAMANTPDTYKLTFTYDGDGKITKIEAAK